MDLIKIYFPTQNLVKTNRTLTMKKFILAGIAGVFVLGMTSCGGGHTCDAYRTSDYTKYKAEKSKKIEVNIRKKK